MSVGDILNPKRVRTQANERLDTVDADALSQAPRAFLDAWSRAIEATPRNAGGSTPVGLILQGFGLTLNPSGPSDGKVRVQSPPGVAFDSDGRMLIKENGVTVDLTLPTGSSQIYAFFIDDNNSTAVRRFISVTSPYVESGSAIATALKGDVAYWVRAGNQTSIVSNDVVNGKTTALCFLGVAVNTAGAVTMAGYDIVSAPNGQYAVNRLSSVTTPTTPPPANTAGGSLATMLDVVTAALYSLGQAMWKGSDHLTPALANNFGAYNIPAGGVDKAFRQALGYATIGNGTTVIGDFNTSDFANNNAMLVAALASLPTAGGRIYVKPGVSLTGFNGATVAMPAGKTIEIIGDHAATPTTTPHFTFVAGEGLACSATGALVLTNLHVSYSACSPIQLQAGPFKIRNVYLSNTGTAISSILAGIRDGAGCTAVNNVDIDGLTWSSNFSAIQLTGALFNIFGSIPCTNVKILNVTHNNAAHEAGLIQINNVLNDVEIGHVVVNQSFATVGLVAGAFMLALGSSDNTTNIQGRYVHDVTVNNTAGTIPKITMLLLGTIGYLRVVRLDTSPTSCNSIVADLSPVTGPVTFEDCVFAVPGYTFALTGVIGDVDLLRCKFLNGALFTIGDGSGVVGRVHVRGCFFSGSYVLTGAGSNVQGTSVEQVLVTDCVFDGISTANFADWQLITVSAATGFVLREARFLRNTVSNFQNVTYTGADATSTPVFFKINAEFVDFAECSDTTCRNIMSNASGSGGNSRRAPYIFQVTTNTSADGTFSNINFERNKSYYFAGDIGGCQALSITNYLAIGNLVIDHNEISFTYNTTTAARSGDVYAMLVGGVGTTTISTCRFTNNTTFIDIGDTVPANLPINVLNCLSVTSFGVITYLEITGNSLISNYVSTSFNGTSGFGMIFAQYAVYVLFCHHNAATRLGVHSVSGFMKLLINTTAQVYNVNGDGGALPGSGVTYPNCYNFWQA